MQHITPQQGDAIIDVLEQCHAVTAAWDQKAAHDRHGDTAVEKDRRKAVETEVAETYKDEVTMLTDLYIRADQLGVDDDVLVGVLVKHLPFDIHLEVKIDTPEPEAA